MYKESLKRDGADNIPKAPTIIIRNPEDNSSGGSAFSAFLDKKQAMLTKAGEFARVKECSEDTPIGEKSRIADSSLCFYDGIKLRSYDPVYITWLKLQSEFNFRITTDPRTGTELRYDGSYEYEGQVGRKKKQFDIEIHITPQGWAADFSGSLHVWSNKGKHNYNDFYWDKFLLVYHEVCKVFKFDPSEILIVNLEVGANCILPDFFPYTSAQIMESIISIFGSCKNKSWVYGPNKDIYKVLKGERYLKIYDKSLQNKLKTQILRLELGYSRSRRLLKDLKALVDVRGPITFADLLKLSIREKLKIELEECFQSIHVFPPELFNVLAQESEGESDVVRYPTPAYWCSLKRNNRRKYQKAKSHQQRLVQQHCSFNLSHEVLKMLNLKLQ